MDVYHWHKYLQDLVIEIVGLETNIRVFRHFLALHHSILWVFEYLIKNGFISDATQAHHTRPVSKQDGNAHDY